MTASHVRFASWRWLAAAGLAALASLVVLLSATAGPGSTPAMQFSPTSAPAPSNVSPALVKLAERHPTGHVEAIVQMVPGKTATGRELVQMAGGRVTRDLHVINGFAARMTADAARRLALYPSVAAVSLNSKVKPSDLLYDSVRLATSFNQSIRSPAVWNSGDRRGTGKGVTVAVLDTGIAGDLVDFAKSRTDSSSRVIATATVNPDATTADDEYGHGTHVAGLIAGNSWNRAAGDAKQGRFMGTAPDANLVSVKVSDDHGATTVLDVILGLQFVVDHEDDLNIKVVNMSLNSSSAESYKTDPIDAAAEEAWNAGITVVAAAGNRGAASDAVNYAPANDPYVITVGAVDDLGTAKTDDDQLATWSSHGTTQDGLTKPEVLAPGAHMISTLAPGSDFESLCPDCVVAGGYFQVGGTSMATAVASGAAADLLQAHPAWTPNQVKSALIKKSRDVKGAGREIALDSANGASKGDLTGANVGLTPSSLIDASTGKIDYSRAGWSRAGWSDAVGPLRAGWSRAGWSCDCAPSAADTSADADPTRAGWSRAGWSRAGWSTSFEK
jgi:serine protease AprX